MVIRRGGLSVRVDRRVVAILVAVVGASLAAFALQLGSGDVALAPRDVLATLGGGGDGAARFVVLDLRLPRAIAAALVGIALGIAGVIFQDLARNALVAPDIIGVSAGASLAAVAAIVFAGSSGAMAVPAAALCGALVAGGLLYALAWRGGMHGFRLVLVGIGLSALFTSGISWVLTQGQIHESARAYLWLVGSLNARGWEHVWPVAAVVAVLAPLAFVLGRRLAAMQLGDELARALGVGVERTRLALFAIALGLTAAAVAAAGPIAFAAFIAPHIARRLCASVSPSAVLAVAAAVGALLVLASDLVGRVAFGAREVPVGIITAILAAPYFLYLLQRTNRLGVTG